MNHPPAIWIVIPVYNRRETTRGCLRLLAEQNVFAFAQVLVVDSSSSDGTAVMIEEEFPQCQLERVGSDLWWTGAISHGMKCAIEAGATCICWLNDDCQPAAGSLFQLTEAAISRRAVCGGCCDGDDGTEAVYSGGYIVNGWPQPLPSPLPSSTEIAVDWLHGNLVAMPACVWHRIGLPVHHWMPHNLADIHYTYLAAQTGIPVLILPDIKAKASINTGISYLSWTDSRISAKDIITGLWNPRVWWYAPGLAYFVTSINAYQGTLQLLKFVLKAITIITLKMFFPRRWISRLKNNRRPYKRG